MDVRFCEGRNHRREARVRAAGSARVRRCALLRSALQENLFLLDKDLHGGRQSGNWDLRPGCSVSTNWRLLGTVHEFESTRSQMDSITMATAIRSKKWKATASPGGENREAGAGARSGSRRLISKVCCG